MSAIDDMRRHYEVLNNQSLHFADRLNKSAAIAKDTDAAILELDERLKAIEAVVFPQPAKYRKPVYLMTPEELAYGHPESDK